MSIKIFVGSLPYSTTDQELEELFAKFGKVVSASIVMDRETNRSRGFGFVEMENDDEGQKAIEELSDSELDGRKLTVNKARPKTN